MLIPALLSLVFKPPTRRGFNALNSPLKHPRLIALELRELLPEIDETLARAELYFNGLEESKGDRIDVLMGSITSDVRELGNLLRSSKSRGVMSLVLRIRRDIERVPRLLSHLMFHSRQPIYQRELAEVRKQYDLHIQKDSLLRDILAFIRAYCVARWKGSEELSTKVTSNVDALLSKDDSDTSA